MSVRGSSCAAQIDPSCCLWGLEPGCGLNEETKQQDVFLTFHIFHFLSAAVFVLPGVLVLCSSAASPAGCSLLSFNATLTSVWEICSCCNIFHIFCTDVWVYNAIFILVWCCFAEISWSVNCLINIRGENLLIGDEFLSFSVLFHSKFNVYLGWWLLLI